MKYILEYYPEFSEPRTWAFESDETIDALKETLKHNYKNKIRFFGRQLNGEFHSYTIYSLEEYWGRLPRLH